MKRNKHSVSVSRLTVIGELLVRLEDVLQREIVLHRTGRPDERRARLLVDEARFLRRKILEEVPQTRADTGILALLALDELDGIDCAEGDSSLELARGSLLRQARFMIDDGTIDLADTLVRELAADVLIDDAEMFPEVAVAPAKRKKAA
jgi:hypothetical protein